MLAEADRKIAVHVDVNTIWFAMRVRGFLFFLTNCKFLTSAKPDAALYREVVEGLVQRNELEKRFLETVDREIEAALNKKDPPRKQMLPEPSIPLPKLPDTGSELPGISPIDLTRRPE